MFHTPVPQNNGVSVTKSIMDLKFGVGGILPPKICMPCIIIQN